jgi:hypothetical protein
VALGAAARARRRGTITGVAGSGRARPSGLSIGVGSGLRGSTKIEPPQYGHATT